MNYIKYRTVDGKLHKRQYDNQATQIILNHMGICKIIEIKGLGSLQRLNLSYNTITKIEGLKSLTSLQVFYLGDNRITKMEGLKDLTSLQELDLHNNSITKMEGLEGLASLQILHLDGNRITKIEGLEDLASLQILYFSDNSITKMEGLEGLASLRELDLHDNRITKIEGLEGSASLQALHLYNNGITKIEGLEDLTSLQILDIANNQIKDIPVSIVNLRSLRTLYSDVSLNPIIYRFLNRNQIKSSRTIYLDGQNVHDSQINRSIMESLYRLLNEKVDCTDQEIIDEIIGDRILSTESKEALVEYSRILDVHSQLNVTFMEALKSVWAIIRKHKQSDEIKKILDGEIQDSICKCQTGRLSRLVNTLNGFDPRVSVRISNSQEISNIIIMAKQKTNNLGEQQKIITNELAERGYSKQTIDEWLVYLE
jgi:hypothetical protein